MATAMTSAAGAGVQVEEFDSLYAKYRRLVRSVLFKLVLRDDVDDLVQETFLKVWGNRNQIREPAKEKAWIVRVAVNVARDAGRKKLRSPKTAELDERNVPGGERRPEEEQLILGGLAELSGPHREVLVLHCLEGMALEEISESLGVALGTVKSRLHYAKAQLHGYLTGKGARL